MVYVVLLYVVSQYVPVLVNDPVVPAFDISVECLVAAAAALPYVQHRLEFQSCGVVPFQSACESVQTGGIAPAPGHFAVHHFHSQRNLRGGLPRLPDYAVILLEHHFLEAVFLQILLAELVGPLHPVLFACSSRAVTAIFRIVGVLLRIRLSRLLPIVPAFLQYVRAQPAIDENGLGVCAPRTSQIAFRNLLIGGKAAVSEHISVLLALQGGGSGHVTVFLRVYRTVFEIADARSENEVSGAFYVAVLVEIALDASVLAVASVGVERVLVAQQAAVSQADEVSVGEKCHGLGYLLAFARAVLNGQPFEGHVARVYVHSRAARGADDSGNPAPWVGLSFFRTGVGPGLAGIFPEADNGAVRALSDYVQAELVVRDRYHFTVYPCLYIYARVVFVAVVRYGVDGLLYAGEVAASVLRNDYVPAGVPVAACRLGCLCFSGYAEQRCRHCREYYAFLCHILLFDRSLSLFDNKVPDIRLD